MTNSKQTLREFAEKIVPVIINASVLCNTEEIIEAFTGDLTALISEHYYPKEKYDELLQQRDELKKENEKLKRQIQSYNPYPNRPNPRDVNPYDIGSVKRARRGR